MPSRAVGANRGTWKSGSRTHVRPLAHPKPVTSDNRDERWALLALLLASPRRSSALAERLEEAGSAVGVLQRDACQPDLWGLGPDPKSASVRRADSPTSGAGRRRGSPRSSTSTTRRNFSRSTGGPPSSCGWAPVCRATLGVSPSLEPATPLPKGPPGLATSGGNLRTEGSPSRRPTPAQLTWLRSSPLRQIVGLG